jgi:hypothetical protein
VLTSTVSPIHAAGTPIFAALSQSVRTWSNFLPNHKNSMQTRPAAVNPLRLRAFAAPASVAGQLRRRRINSKLTRCQEDDDSK